MPETTLRYVPPASRLRAAVDRARTVGSHLGVLSAVTGLGWLVFIASVLAWAVGERLGWIELTLSAVTGVLTLAFCAMLAIGRTALRIELDPERRRMVVGESMQVGVQVTNLSAHRLLMLTMEVVVGPVLVPVDLPNSLVAGATFDTELTVNGQRRGVIPVGPATSVRGDPIGLVRRQVSWAEKTEVFVHPRTTRLVPFGFGLLRDLEGRTTEDVSMSDLAFHTLREYVPGDDRRYIHWRSSAKVGSAVPGGKFLVRQFRDTRRTHLLVIVDGNAASYVDEEEFETAISVAASVALQATADELDASLLVADQPTVRIRGRDTTSNRVLDVFARAETSSGPGTRRLASQVALAGRTAPDATYAVIVTGANTTFHALRRATAQLSSAVRVTIVRVDPMASSGIVSVSNPTALTLARLEDLRGLLSRGEAS